MTIDLNKNCIPEDVKTIHMIAICGTGMGALACILKDMGFQISGSDQKIYPPMSHYLSSKGIDIIDGFKKNNISLDQDLIVVGNAVTKSNPEVVRMQKMGLNFCSMPQAINRFLASGKKPIVVTGTHGKTTTSSILAWILYTAGLDPSFIIGGILLNFNSNYRYGNGEYIVIEGDEYDTAFFDKRPKFLHYDPFMAILTSVEFDHADIFEDMNHVWKAFDIFISGISSNSTLIACNENKEVAKLVHDSKCKVEEYGRDIKLTWCLEGISIEPPWTFFKVLKCGKHIGTFKTKLMGEHNLLDILSAIAIADNLLVPLDVIHSGIESFNGIKRRQEARGIKKGITIIDDFAHHPTAVKETIRAIKPFYSEGRLMAVFEPRTNSSMRKVFQNIYPLSFDHADIICIRKPPLLEKIPFGERFSSEQLVDDLKNRGKKAYYFQDTESIIDFIVKESIAGDVVLIMSNGGFDNIHERLLDLL